MLKKLIATSLVAVTLAASAVAVATPASAIALRIGPRGVGVGLGRGVYRRPFVRRPFVGPRRGVVIRRGFRRF